MLTRSDYERIGKLRARGLGWSEISEVMGRKPESLRVMHWHYRKGHVKFRTEKSLIIVDELELGLHPREIADQLGIEPKRVYKTLARQGYDAEVRREIVAHQPLKTRKPKKPKKPKKPSNPPKPRPRMDPEQRRAAKLASQRRYREEHLEKVRAADRAYQRKRSLEKVRPADLEHRGGMGGEQGEHAP